MASQFVYGLPIRDRSVWVGRSSAFFHQRIFGASHCHKRMVYGDSSRFSGSFLALDSLAMRLILLLGLDLVISSSAWGKVASSIQVLLTFACETFTCWHLSVKSPLPSPTLLSLTILASICHPNRTRKKGRYTHSSLSNYNILLLLLLLLSGCRCCQILRNLIEV